MEPSSTPPAAPDQARAAPAASLAVRGVVGCALVVTAIGAFAAWFTGHYAEKFAQDKRAKVREDMQLVFGALEAYREANGNYPEHLGALWVADPHGFTYLPASHPPKDPWGNGYGYAPPGPGQDRPRLWSYGRDKREGGDGESEDVKSWEDKP
ncbi:MAG: type II secretion system protein GspG [Planctomycetes bacterium]|nr:type II secretion system protein GspG [Planctomycetota bacterium]